MKKSTSAAVIKPTELAKQTGLSARWLSEMASKGIVEKVPGGYGNDSTARIVKHYRESAGAGRLSPLDAVRKLLLEDKLAKSRKELIPVAELRVALTTAIHSCKSRILALPEIARVELGLTEAQSRTIAGRVNEALLELSRIKLASR